MWFPATVIMVDFKGKPDVSVVITAHDAASTIEPCLESVAASAAHAGLRCEILLVDDRSRDRTTAIARGLGLKGLAVLNIERYRGPGLSARQVALDMGFRRARGAFILVTDADAVVPLNWVGIMTDTLQSGGGDAVAGPIEFRGRPALLRNLQSLDALLYFAASRCLNRMGFAGGAFFANFGFRRQAYEILGGFSAMGFSLIEDHQFSKRIHEAGRTLEYRCGSVVSVLACGGIVPLLRRILRVSFGGVSVLSVAIGAWLLSLPLLLFLALIDGPLMLSLLALRVGLGWMSILFILKRRWISLLPLALVFEWLVVAVSVPIMVGRTFHPHVEWGGVLYRR